MPWFPFPFIALPIIDRNNWPKIFGNPENRFCSCRKNTPSNNDAGLIDFGNILGPLLIRLRLNTLLFVAGMKGKVNRAEAR